MEKFRAYRIHEVDKQVSARFEDMTVSELDPGDAVIRVAYSCINYKDALAATGAGMQKLTFKGMSPAGAP